MEMQASEISGSEHVFVGRLLVAATIDAGLLARLGRKE